MMQALRARSQWPGRGMALAWIALLITLAFTLASWWYVTKSEEREASQRFGFAAREASDTISERMAV